jgi:hypothetical protein
MLDARNGVCRLKLTWRLLQGGRYRDFQLVRKEQRCATFAHFPSRSFRSNVPHKQPPPVYHFSKKYDREEIRIIVETTGKKHFSSKIPKISKKTCLVIWGQLMFYCLIYIIYFNGLYRRICPVPCMMYLYDVSSLRPIGPRA